MKRINVNITDIDESVKIGEELEEEVMEKVASKHSIFYKKLPKFSDMDYICLRNSAFFVEIKVRGKYYEETMLPERKYAAALNIHNSLKIKSYYIAYYQDIDKIYKYDILKPYRFEYITRKDRNKRENYAFYREKIEL